MLSGGTILLGALWGRVSATESDALLREMVCQFRKQFIAFAGHAQCQAIRDSLPEGEKRCLPIIVGGARVLLDLIDGQATSGSRLDESEN